MSRKLAAALLILVSLGACQSAQVEEVPPTVSVLTVAISPALRSLAPEMQACVEELPATGLALIDSTGEAASPGLVLQWGADPAPPGYAAVIGEEELVVIVNPDNPVKKITFEDLRAMYQGSLVEWDGALGEVEAWAYPRGVDAQRVFESKILSNEVVNPHAAGIVPDPAAMIQTVASSPYAVGFIPKNWLSSEVKAVEVDKKTPEQMRSPILALSKGKPASAQQAWLICLQDALK